MIKEFAAVLCSVAALAGATSASGAASSVHQAPNLTAEEFLAQPLTAQLTPKNGLSIASPLAEIGFGSSVIVVEPPWREKRFYSMDNSEAVVTETEAGLLYELKQTNDTNKVEVGEYSCLVNGNTATITLDCKPTADIPNLLEYCVMIMPFSLVENANYTVELSDGTILSANQIQDPQTEDIVPFYTDVKKITFVDQLGTLSLDLVEGVPFNIVDRREHKVCNWPAFWVGYQMDLPYGDHFRSVIKVTYEPSSDLVIAEPMTTATAPMATEVVAEGIKPYKPELKLFPVPQEIEQPEDGGFFTVYNDEIAVAISGLDDEAEYNRLAKASERIFDKMDITANVMGRGARVGNSVQIVVEEGAFENPEQYTMAVAPNQISIKSATPRGAFYALQTLRTLYKDGKFPEVKINDWPDMEIRAAHLLVDDYSHIFHTNLVDDILAPTKYNAVLVECEYVQWDTTEKYNMHQPWGMSKEEYVEFVQWCADNYIDIIPLFQTLGHCGWMFPKQPDGSYLNTHWAEDPRYPYAYNVSAPGLYEFIEEALDEVMEASGNPKYLHIGHDEVFHPKAEYPYRPENVEKGLNQILLDDIMWYHDYGQKNDVEIMFWHDLFVTRTESPENGGGGDDVAEVRKNMSRDLIFVPWRYDGKVKEFLDVKALAEEGFKQIGATWNEPNNIENLTSYCYEHGALGMIQTIWCGYNGNKMVTHNGFGQLVPYVRTGVWSWNCDWDLNVFNHEQMFNDLTVDWHNPKQVSDVTVVDISPATNLKLDMASNPFMQDTNFGMDELAVGDVQIGSVKFRLPSRDGVPSVVAVNSRLNPLFPEVAEIPVELDDVENLYVLLTSVNAYPAMFDNMGSIVVEYDNGETVEFPLSYKWQLSSIVDNFGYYQNTTNARSWEHDGIAYNNWFTKLVLPKDKSGKIKSVKLKSNGNGTSLYLLGLSVE